MKDRTKITSKEYQKAIDMHGHRCNQCGHTYIEMHHVKYRSQSGKGQWRNLVPLCNKHHTLVHSSSRISEMRQNYHETLFGKYYWCDKYDLYKMGLIVNLDDDEFEAFMQSQELVEPEPYVHDQFDFPFSKKE